MTQSNFRFSHHKFIDDEGVRWRPMSRQEYLNRTLYGVVMRYYCVDEIQPKEIKPEENEKEVAGG